MTARPTSSTSPAGSSGSTESAVRVGLLVAALGCVVLGVGWSLAPHSSGTVVGIVTGAGAALAVAACAFAGTRRRAAGAPIVLPRRFADATLVTAGLVALAAWLSTQGASWSWAVLGGLVALPLVLLASRSPSPSPSPSERRPS